MLVVVVMVLEELVLEGKDLLFLIDLLLRIGFLVGLCDRLVSLCAKGVDLDFLAILAKRNASSASRLLSLVGILEILLIFLSFLITF